MMANKKLLASLVQAGVVASEIAATKPHIIFVLQDDLGWNDVGWHNEAMLGVSSNLTALAREGVILENHLTHYHCSPSRRSFLSGRLAIHHDEGLSDNDQDHLDLRWTLISGKMKDRGYRTHWVGKGHTGWKSVNHLPLNRGFDSFLGFLGGGQSYTASHNWQDDGPITDNTYSTTAHGERVLDIIKEHPAEHPLFVYLAWQAVHSPYDEVPNYDCKTEDYAPYPGVYAQMLHAADDYVFKIVEALKAKEMYNNTLIVFTSDNGGVAWNGLSGNNFPLRGEKHGNWAGGYRTATFMAGGYLPDSLRGTKHYLRMSIVDWYPTFCALGGGSAEECSDDAAVAPLPVPTTGLWPQIGADMSKCEKTQHEVVDQAACQAEAINNGHRFYQYAGNVNDSNFCHTSSACSSPQTGTGWPWKIFTSDIYGTDSFPGLDGVDIWPLLLSSGSDYRAHASLAVSSQVILKGQLKLIIGQGDASDSGTKTRPDWGKHPGQPPTDGWHLADGSWIEATSVNWTCGMAYGKNAVYIPCLFNEAEDFRELTDLSLDRPRDVDALWGELNATMLTAFAPRSPPELLGPCNAKCAKAYWITKGGDGDGPICGVPGCDPEDELTVV